MDSAYGASMVEGFKGALRFQVKGSSDEVTEGDADAAV
jgi:hypothetical protein